MWPFVVQSAFAYSAAPCDRGGVCWFIDMKALRLLLLFLLLQICPLFFTNVANDIHAIAVGIENLKVKWQRFYKCLPSKK